MRRDGQPQSEREKRTWKEEVVVSNKASSPVQYLKSIRLHKARMLMVHDGLGAAIAANRACYESPSQFSREFKRYFGNAPIEEAQHVRKMLGIHAVGNAFVD